MKNTLFGLAIAFVSLSAIAGCSSNAGSDDSSSSDEASRASKCSDASDCHGSLPRNEETCSDGSSSGASWSCESSKCKITYCTDDSSGGGSASNSCSSKDDCDGPLPRIEYTCADGSHSGAEWSCTDHTCAITSCVGAGGPSTGGSTEGSCDSADDCSGALPRNEVGCADGSFSGAEWACNSHKCAISYCADNGGTAN
jgi:hypothetical protein